MLAAFLGFGFFHGSFQSPRTDSLPASFHISEGKNRVESRLWQDPFEAFESATNQADSPDNGSPVASGQTNNLSCQDLIRQEISERSSNGQVVILGVLLQGGSYAEDKEIRLRTRYAVELALLTEELRPEDRTHIFTNMTSLDLGALNIPSRYAYEWFKDLKSSSPHHVCVMWLDEDDFGNEPVLLLGSLFKNILPANDLSKVSFCLVGPRASDTLRALDKTDASASTNDFFNLTNLIGRGRFHILSPEATASIGSEDYGDYDDHDICRDLDKEFGTNVFYNWIAPDQQIANLISRELTNRLAGPLLESTNVVVLLSEQDTYYGSKLADEWIAALVTNGVCKDADYVWQYEYLAGLDGSKPQAQKQDESPTLPASPEAALQTAMQQQEEGLQADGDAQLDYIMRLGKFLKQKDQEMKARGEGRIIAFGLTGSDVVDKLYLLHELRHLFPEAVFFSTDLDASLWTTKDLKFTHNLLVGSAYPLNPSISEDNTQPFWDQFPPFRDVYQTAVFRASEAVIDAMDDTNLDELKANSTNLLGGLYVIGREGPVPLTIKNGNPVLPQPNPIRGGWLWLLVLFVSLSTLLAYFFVGLKGGIERHMQKVHSRPCSKAIVKAENMERERRISRSMLQITTGCAVAIGLVLLVFQYLVWSIASKADEEPWSFSEGASIWASEYIRLLVLFLGIFFFWIAGWRRRRHRKKLWKEYFCEDEAADEDFDKSWDHFYNECSKRWNPGLSPGEEHGLLESDAFQLWQKAGKPRGEAWDDWIQAETEMRREKCISLFFNWTPPFIDKSGEAFVNATALFRSYLNLGQVKKRVKRMLSWAAVYILLAISMFFYFHDFPTMLLIRGHDSHDFDFIMTVLAVGMTLLVLFYVVDATLLTKRILDYISSHPTCWPERRLRKNAADFGIRPEHLDGLLDVDFAAVQTAEIGPLMFGPIILQLLLLISRSPYFDDWTWPPCLVVIFAINFLTAAICWWAVRGATDNVRKDALNRMEEATRSVENLDKNSLLEVPRNPTETRKVSASDYLENLKKVRTKIENEHRGAFAKFFQDPTSMAVFIPSSLSGIGSVVFSYFISR